MLRNLTWIVPVLLLCGVGCKTCGEKKPLFSWLHDSNDKDKHATPTSLERHDDRLAYLPGSSTNCAPCAASSGVVLNNSYGNLPMGVPLGTSYVVPGSSNGGTLGTPQLSAPVMPYGTKTSPDNELPTPGGYSNVTPAEMGRSTAPKPPTTLIGK